MDAVSLLKGYLTTQLNDLLTKYLGELFDLIEKDIWKIFNPLMRAIQNAIIGEVGEIPFVGGILAVAVNVLFDVLYGVIRKAVDLALYDAEILLQAEIVKAIVDAIMATGLYTDAALAAQKIESASLLLKSDADANNNQTKTMLRGKRGVDLGSEMEKAASGASQEPMSKSQKQMTDQAASGQDAAQKAAKGQQDEITSEGNSASQEENEDAQQDNEVIQSENEEDIKDDDDSS